MSELRQSFDFKAQRADGFFFGVRESEIVFDAAFEIIEFTIQGARVFAIFSDVG